jgi:DNA-binding NtrC family response regulator
MVEPEDLGIGEPAARARRPPGWSPAEPPLDDPLALAERLKLERALAAADGVVAKAAQALGLSRQALYRRMERYGLAVERRLRG